MKELSVVGLIVAFGLWLNLTRRATARTRAESAELIHNFGPNVPQTYSTHPEQLVNPHLAALLGPLRLAQLYSSLQTDGVVPIDSIRISSSYSSCRSGITYVYLQQMINGLIVCNAVANVNVVDGRRVISSGNSFYRGPLPSDLSENQGGESGLSPQLSASNAVLALAFYLNKTRSTETKMSDLHETPLNSEEIQKSTQKLSLGRMVKGAPFSRSPINATLKYIQLDFGRQVRLSWELAVELGGEGDLYSAVVDARTGEVLALNCLVSDLVMIEPSPLSKRRLRRWGVYDSDVPSSAYKVYPLGVNDPDDGPRKLVSNPFQPHASPYGWHSEGLGWSDTKYTDTRGNNVHAQSNPDAEDNFEEQHRPNGGPTNSKSLVFKNFLDLSQDPAVYEDAAITNLFYWSNIMHDLLYEYGFDEVAGNFQRNNFAKGGQGNDPVIAFAQYGRNTGHINNADFRTPPDGFIGVMRMFLWDATSPRRDGDLEGGIVVHEYAHGLSTRLTVGPANVDCLFNNEGGGMGEGWGDALATVLRVNESSTRHQDFSTGSYLIANKAGLVRFLYSTNMVTNPYTYAFLSHEGYDEVHSIGEVWTALLYEVFWNLVDQAGFEQDWFKVDSYAGNIVFLQLVIEGLKLQPCTPTFVNARDAILEADEYFGYDGRHNCAIWAGFAKRGLGFSAQGPTEQGTGWNGQEAFDMPPYCESYQRNHGYGLHDSHLKHDRNGPEAYMPRPKCGSAKCAQGSCGQLPKH